MAGKRANGEGTVVPVKKDGRVVGYRAEWSYVEDSVLKGTSKYFGLSKYARAHEEAHKHLRLATAAVAAKTYVVPVKGTVAEWLDLWMSGTAFSDLAPQTRTAYRRHVRAMKPRIGHLQLQELNAGHLNAMYADLLKTGNHAKCCRKGKPCGSHQGASGLSKTSVRHHHATLASALREAVDAKVGITHAVTADARQPSAKAAKSEAKKWEAWTKHELRTFLEITKDDPYFPIWLMLATTGCRRGEVLGMRWSDVDWDSEAVVVHQTIGKDDDDGSTKVIIQNSLKGGDGHSISLDPVTMAMLRRHKRATAEYRLSRGEKWQDNDLVFYRGMGGKRSSTPGAPLNGETVSATFTETIDGLPEVEEVKKIRLHDLRHTWATLALKAGVNPKIVQERLGHSHVSVTLGIYSHVQPGMDREAANLVAGMFT